MDRCRRRRRRLDKNLKKKPNHDQHIRTSRLTKPFGFFLRFFSKALRGNDPGFLEFICVNLCSSLVEDF